jgi:hypothetical protein
VEVAAVDIVAVEEAEQAVEQAKEEGVAVAGEVTENVAGN